MGIKLDFSMIIAGLVLLQLYVLGMNTKKKKTKTTKKLQTTTETVQDKEVGEVAAATITLTVLRGNGEEKVYSKTDVA